MPFWFEPLVFSALLALLAFALLRNRGSSRRGKEALGAYVELVFQHGRLQDDLLQVAAAFCRQDFIERKLLVKIEAYQDEDDPGQWVAEGNAAPYGTPGSYWTFGATSYIRDGKRFARVWIVAEPGGYPVSLKSEFQQGRDDEYERATAFIELARAKHDLFKAYPHEEATAIIEAFFGEETPCFATSCFGDAHVRTPAALG